MIDPLDDPGGAADLPSDFGHGNDFGHSSDFGPAPADHGHPTDWFVPTSLPAHDPFPNVADLDQHAQLPPQVHVEPHAGVGGGGASAAVIDVPGRNDDGSLSLVGDKHQLGYTQLGDTVQVWLPGHNDSHPVDAEVVYIHRDHDIYVARLDPATAQAVRENFSVTPTFHTGAAVGESVAFTQQVGVPHPVLRHGLIAGDGDASGGLKSLTGTDGTPGSSGALVCDREGHIVGQVVAYDAQNHVNLMSSAEQLLGDLRDFRDGVNTEFQASPVSYTGATAPRTGG